MNLRPAALALLCAAAACGSATGPAPAREFALDVTSPVVLHAPGTRYTVLEETLRLEADGTAVRAVRQRLDFADPALADTVVEVREDYTWAADGGDIALTNVCPARALCAQVRFFWGTMDDDGLRLQIYIDPGVPLTYRRRGA